MAEMKPVQLKVRSEADASATPACITVKGQGLVSGSQSAGRGVRWISRQCLSMVRAFKLGSKRNAFWGTPW